MNEFEIALKEAITTGTLGSQIIDTDVLAKLVDVQHVQILKICENLNFLSNLKKSDNQAVTEKRGRGRPKKAYQLGLVHITSIVSNLEGPARFKGFEISKVLVNTVDRLSKDILDYKNKEELANKAEIYPGHQSIMQYAYVQGYSKQYKHAAPLSRVLGMIATTYSRQMDIKYIDSDEQNLIDSQHGGSWIPGNWYAFEVLRHVFQYNVFLGAVKESVEIAEYQYEEYGGADRLYRLNNMLDIKDRLLNGDIRFPHWSDEDIQLKTGTKAIGDFNGIKNS